VRPAPRLHTAQATGADYFPGWILKFKATAASPDVPACAGHTTLCAGVVQTTQSFRQISSCDAWNETVRALQYHRAKILRMDKLAQNRFNCASGTQHIYSLYPNTGL
jgi:hypothetical protein